MQLAARSQARSNLRVSKATVFEMIVEERRSEGVIVEQVRRGGFTTMVGQRRGLEYLQGPRDTEKRTATSPGQRGGQDPGLGVGKCKIKD